MVRRAILLSITIAGMVFSIANIVLEHGEQWINFATLSVCSLCSLFWVFCLRSGDE